MKYLAVLVLLLPIQDQKLPVPNAADQKKGETEIRSIFKEDFAKKTRDGKRSLAQKLLKEAGDEKNTAVARYVVLLLSRDLAAESLDLATLFSSIDQLGKLYDVEKPVLTGATFTSSTNALKVAALNSAQMYASAPDDSVRADLVIDLRPSDAVSGRPRPARTPPPPAGTPGGPAPPPAPRCWPAGGRCR